MFRAQTVDLKVCRLSGNAINKLSFCAKIRRANYLNAFKFISGGPSASRKDYDEFVQTHQGSIRFHLQIKTSINNRNTRKGDAAITNLFHVIKI